MELSGGIVVGVGSVLFLVALAMTIRANPNDPVPFTRSPVISPRGSVVLRSIGAGLIVLGSAALASAVGYASILVVLAAPVAALVAIVVHNRRVAARRAG